MLTKGELRDTYKNKRLSVIEPDRENASQKVAKSLMTLVSELSVTVLACYFPFSQEINPFPFLTTWMSSTKTVVFPRYNVSESMYEMVKVTDIDHDFILGFHNIMEPESRLPVLDKSVIDLWLVPGIVFDHSCNRIGFGQGVYDRLLDGVSATTVALAYDWQVISSIPSDSFDKKMDIILTDATLYKKQGQNDRLGMPVL